MQVLADSLEHLQSQAVEAVLPIFKAAADEVEACLLQMHAVDWAAAGGGAVVNTSAFVQRLEAFLKRFRLDFLSHFVPQPSPSVPSFAALLCQRLAARTLTFFVRHASLLPSLSEAGKLQLTKVRSSVALAQQPVRNKNIFRLVGSAPHVQMCALGELRCAGTRGADGIAGH